MAGTHTPPRHTYKTNTRRRTSLRLPQATLGGIALTLFIGYVAIRTWPIQAAALAAMLAAAAVIRAIRPRWLTRITTRLARITPQRAALPAPGRRTTDALHRLKPGHFEQAIAELALEHPDVHTATHVGQANDRGADVIAHLYDGRRILIQCKRNRAGNNVGSETVQTINGVYRDIHHCHQAVIVTTAGFTRAAYDTNARLPQGIRLVDGNTLEAWANGHAPAPW